MHRLPAAANASHSHLPTLLLPDWESHLAITAATAAAAAAAAASAGASLLTTTSESVLLRMWSLSAEGHRKQLVVARERSGLVGSEKEERACGQ